MLRRHKDDEQEVARWVGYGVVLRRMEVAFGRMPPSNVVQGVVLRRCYWHGSGCSTAVAGRVRGRQGALWPMAAAGGDAVLAGGAAVRTGFSFAVFTIIMGSARAALQDSICLYSHVLIDVFRAAALHHAWVCPCAG